MFTATAIGPSLAELRPLKAAWAPDGQFPVHPDLVDRLVAHDPAAEGQADPVVAHTLAVCSAYAYSSVVGFGGVPDTMARMIARLGLPGNRVLMVAERNDAAFIVASGFVIQSADGSAVILAFRGTEPFNVASWMTDADLDNGNVTVEVGDKQFSVHQGFYRNVRAIRSPLIEALDRASEGRSIIDGSPLASPMRALHITGHSLGAAMAALQCLLLLEDPAYGPLKAVTRSCYGFGQPMIGPRSLADSVTEAGHAERFLRFIFHRDVVPGLPPRGLGDYAHFGLEYRVARDGGYQRDDRTKRQSSYLAIPIAPLQFLCDRVPLLRRIPFWWSLDDHLPLNYVDWLAPVDQASEYGDYPARLGW